MLIELQGANDLTKPTGTAAPLILQHPYTSLSAVQKQLQALIWLIHWGLPWWRWAGWFIVTCGRSRDSTKTWVFNKLRKSETHYCDFFLYSSKLSVNTSTCYSFLLWASLQLETIYSCVLTCVARVTRWRAVSLVLRVSSPRVKSATEIYRYLPPPPPEVSKVVKLLDGHINTASRLWVRFGHSLTPGQSMKNAGAKTKLTVRAVTGVYHIYTSPHQTITIPLFWLLVLTAL